MKKSLLALAVLGAFAGAASAQSNVTLYGRVDLSAGKGAGVGDERMANGSGSRLGLRGVEDLGGGLQALFNIEHRFDADTGFVSNQRFWHGRSIVGVQGGFGQVVLGREYTTSFLQSQLVADPWGWDTVVSGSLGGSGGNTSITGGGQGLPVAPSSFVALPPAVIARLATFGITTASQLQTIINLATVRNDSSLTYKLNLGGFTFGAQVAEATDTITNTQDKPWNVAASYAAGPITAGVAYEVNGRNIIDKAEWLTVNGAFAIGGFKIGGFYGTGTSALGSDRESYMATLTWQLGAGELRASYGELKDDFFGKLNKTGALGYHYSLSKRTTIYADVISERGTVIDQLRVVSPTADGSDYGYDFGIKHNF